MDDRLSTLPDPILCHILSFLPSEESVATSLLSKRWMPLWRSVPTLDFDDANYVFRDKQDYSRFVGSVYAFILSRNQHQPIHKLRIRLQPSHLVPPRDPSNLTVWVNSALQQPSRVQHLDISFTAKNPFLPPIISPVIYSCTINLVVLKLEGFSLKPLSSVVDGFPMLKTLHLQDLRLLEYEWLALLLSTSRCPLLQDFKAEGLFFTYHSPDGKFESLPVQFLHISQIIKLMLNEDLHIGEITNHSMLCNNLTHIELSSTTFNKDLLNLVEVLKYCPQLQVLVINQQHDLNYEIAEIEFELRVWQCPKSAPECILLHLKRCYLSDYRGTEGEFQFVKYIMQNGRVLERMTIYSCPYAEEQEKHEDLKKLSSCSRRSANCELFFED